MTARKTARERAYATAGVALRALLRNGEAAPYAKGVEREILAAIDAAIAEARDGALEEAAALADDHNGEECCLKRTRPGIMGIEAHSRAGHLIRALKRGGEGGK